MKNFSKINSFSTISNLMIKGILYRKLVAKKLNKGEAKLFFQDPLFVAKVRYAKGEINKRQFNEIRKNLMR